jgi:CHC2 zinc finger
VDSKAADSLERNSADAEAQRVARRFCGVSYVRPIDAAKEAVPIIDLADRLCGSGGLRHVGKEWVGRCPLPDHSDRTPSFTVNKAKNLWWCHGCLRGGDVVELARLAWGYDQRDAHVAAATLLMEFGHEVPQRQPAWFHKQARQAPVRRALEGATRRRCQRRIYRWLFAPIVARLEDEAERLDEARASWEDAGQIAAMIVAHARQERVA